MESKQERRVDYAAIRVSQMQTIGLLLLAFVLDSVLLAGLVALIMLVGAAVPRFSLFQLVYRFCKQAGIVKPDILVDNPEPHRFAHGLGGGVVALGCVALVLGLVLIGWGLIWVVILLASANLLLGFCAGCFIYYQLNRLNVPGFDQSPIQRT